MPGSTAATSRPVSQSLYSIRQPILNLCNSKMHSVRATDVPPDAMMADDMKGGRRFERISATEHSDVSERNEVKERHIVDLQKNMSQSSPRGILKISDAELGETGQLQEGLTEGSARTSPIKTEIMEPFKFDSRSSSPGSFLNPVSLTKQPLLDGFDPSLPSAFDFSAMRAEIFMTTMESKTDVSGTATPDKVRDGNDLIEKKAEYLQQMPIEESTLHRILPSSAFDRLIESLATCVSPTKTGKRCRIKLRDPREKVPDMLESIACLDVRKDWEAIYPKLRSIVEMVLCRSPHRKIAKAELLALNARAIKQTAEQGSETVDSFDEPVMALMEPWFKAIFKDSHAMAAKLRDRLGQGENAKCDDVNQSMPSEVKQSERLQHCLKFLPYRPNSHRHLPLDVAIRAVLNTPLSRQELDPKYLYIFWSRGMFGRVKIGIADNVPERLRSWKQQCKHIVQEHVEEGAGERPLVQHAYRVEKLIQTELREVRLKQINCPGCGGSHIEWFSVAAAHADKVLKKYSDWAATNPYQLDKQSGQWVLDKGIRKSKIEEICEPIVVQT